MFIKNNYQSDFISYSKINIIKRKLLFVIGILIIFRLGSFIPIPGIDIIVFSNFFKQQQGTILEIFNTLSGGALSRASIFTLGIMPYISSSIIIQLLLVMYPKLLSNNTDNELSNFVTLKYTRYVTLIIAILQSIGIIISFMNIPGMQGLIINKNFIFYLVAIMSIVCGTITLMWLSEKNNEYGIGNGISLIIFAGIISSLPTYFISVIKQIKQNKLSIFSILLIISILLLIIFFIIFIEQSEYCIPVKYIKMQSNKCIYIYKSIYLPIKLNIAGITPAIFAASLILFPSTLAKWFGKNNKLAWLNTIALYLQSQKLIHNLLYAIAIIFFCFFYTNLIFNISEISNFLNKNNIFIPNIYFGKQTIQYIYKIVFKITCFSSIYMVFICLIPEILYSLQIPFYFNSTSLLVIIIIIIEFINHIKAILISDKYQNLLKKENFNIKNNF